MRENGPRVLETKYNGTQTVAVGAGAVAYSAAISLTDLSDFALEYSLHRYAFTVNLAVGNVGGSAHSGNSGQISVIAY